MNECMGRGCSKCLDACNKKCIDFHMSDEEIIEEIGSIVVATGLEPYDPREMDPHGSPNYDIGLDGQFLIIESTPVIPSSKINFAINWFEKLVKGGI